MNISKALKKQNSPNIQVSEFWHGVFCMSSRPNSTIFNCKERIFSFQRSRDHSLTNYNTHALDQCVVVDVSGWEGDAIAVRYEQAWVRTPRLLQPGGSVALVDGLRDDIP